MKKIIICTIAAALILLVAFTYTALAVEVVEIAAEVAQGAGAIEEIAEGGTLPLEPFTWAALVTVAGCTVFALLFVQLIKAPLDKVWHIPTRLLVYIVCLVAMLAGTAFTSGLTIDSGLLAVVNAVIPALAAMGAYEMAFAKIDNKKKPPDDAA